MRTVELAPGRLAHASGALWLPGEAAILVADVHLGYGWALRRRGHLGPVQDSAVKRKLFDVVEELRPRTIVFAGDIVHAPRPSAGERDAIESTLRELGRTSRLILIPGNHDRAFHRDFKELDVEMAEAWRSNGLVAVHGHKRLDAGGEHVVLGHLHPAVGVMDHAGATHRLPAFVSGDRATILPAFSPMAAGFDVREGLPLELGEVRIVAVSGKRAVDLGPLSRIQALKS